MQPNLTLNLQYPEYFSREDIIAEQILMYCFTQENDSPLRSQRQLAQKLHTSLGRLNRSMQALVQAQLLTGRIQLTEESRSLCQQKRPQRAILFADSPAWTTSNRSDELPCLLPVQDLPLIERLIRQLRQAGVPEILIVTGYHKEALEYLSEKPGIRLLHNLHFREGGTLSSLYTARQYLNDAYLLPAHLYFEESPFFSTGLHSWLALSSEIRDDGPYSVLSTRQLCKTGYGHPGYCSWHLAYLTRQDAKQVQQQLELLWSRPNGRAGTWERVLFEPHLIPLPIRPFSPSLGFSCDTAENYLDLLNSLDRTQQSTILWAARQLKTTADQFEWETPLKKGMTNRTLVFRYKGTAYALRVPGAGSEKLLNRKEEDAVYRAISNWKYAEPVVAFDSNTGKKLSRFLPSVRNCDARSPEDLTRALTLIRDLHDQKFQVRHRFDCFQKIEQYRELCAPHTSPFKHHEEVYEQILQLQSWLDQLPQQEVLCHMDFHPDNLLYSIHGEQETLIDWEYAGMQDPLFELAMFAIYSGFNQEEIDALADEYFALGGETCPFWKRLRLYAYIACGGFLWNLWCQYKSLLGIEFGSYWQQQYQYAKIYARMVLEKLPELERTRTHNAIILAAGASSRFVPYSLERPKALWPYRGEILLERQIRQLREAGIQEILLVTGHQAEAYQELANTYGLECVYNPLYETHNNLSSLACVADRLHNSYICSVDNYFEHNPFEPYVQTPYYATQRVTGQTEEWCVSTLDSGRISAIEIGGRDSLILCGHVRIDESFAQALRPHLLAAAVDPNCTHCYWEDVWLQHLEDLTLYARIYSSEEIQEFDSLQDILQSDPSYWENTPCPAFDAACVRAGIDRLSCSDFQPIRSVHSSLLEGYRFRCNETGYTACLEGGEELRIGFQLELGGEMK